MSLIEKNNILKHKEIFGSKSKSSVQINIKSREEILKNIYVSLDEEPNIDDLRKVDPLKFLEYRQVIGDIGNKNL